MRLITGVLDACNASEGRESALDLPAPEPGHISPTQTHSPRLAVPPPLPHQCSSKMVEDPGASEGLSITSSSIVSLLSG